MGMTIINNYEMPSNCYMCDLHNYHECDLTGESIEEDYCWNEDSREKHCPLREVEAIPKADYETRLKADMVAELTEIQVGIGEHINPSNHTDSYEDGWSEGAEWCIDYIQEIISAWQPCKENKDGTNS